MTDNGQGQNGPLSNYTPPPVYRASQSPPPQPPQSLEPSPLNNGAGEHGASNGNGASGADGHSPDAVPPYGVNGANGNGAHSPAFGLDQPGALNDGYHGYAAYQPYAPEFGFGPVPGSDGIGGPKGKTGAPTDDIPHASLSQLKDHSTLQDGRYTVLKKLGSGGMGHVYLVSDQRLGTHLALKEMISTERNPKTGIETFRRETEMLVAGQGHTGIPHIYDSFVEFGRAYIVLDYVDGKTLDVTVKEAAQHGAFLTETEVGEWMRQLCDIVQYLHTLRPPIIFRDLKPQNVMLTPQGRIVLIDFGIAKYFLSEEEQTNVGTRGYAAPEQYEGRADPRSDIYCIGAMMHHLLTGVDPRHQAPFSFHLRPPSAINPKLSPMMEAVIMQCVEYNASKRYQTALDLKTAIDIALGRAVAPKGTGQVFGGRNTSTRSAQLEDALRRAPIVETTRPLWVFQAEAPIKSTPTIFDGKLYFGSDDNSMRAIDVRNGRLIWQVATEGPICDKAAVWRDLLIFGSHDFNVYALDARTGDVAWRYRTWQQVNSSPLVYDDHVYIGSNDGFLHAIEPRTGRMMWRFKTYNEVISTPAAAKGTIYFGSKDENIYAVDALTGDRNWKHSTDGEVNSSPVVVDDYLYVGSYDHGVYCLEAKSGWQAWCERTNDRIAASPLIVGDRLYIGSVDGALYCLNRRTGQQIWHYTIGRQVNSTAAYANGAIYFGANDGAVYSVDTQSGLVRWRFATGDAVLGSPVVHDNVVYIGSTDGVLYALEANPPGLRGD